MLLALAALTFGCSSESSDGTAASGTTVPAAEAAANATGGSMYVITATGGTLSADTLELTGVEVDATSFTDRPDRETSVQPITDLVAEWDALGFVADAPNAALVTFGTTGHATTVVELGTPTAAGTTLTFPVRTLNPGDADGALAALPARSVPSGTLTDPSLFIDAGSTGTLVAFSIGGTWGAGPAKVTIDDWAGFDSPLPAGAMVWQLGQPDATQFSANSDSFAVVSTTSTSGELFAIGTTSSTSLAGDASLPAGSDLTITVCGSGGPTTAFPDGRYSIPIPADC